MFLPYVFLVFTTIPDLKNRRLTNIRIIELHFNRFVPEPNHSWLSELQRQSDIWHVII